MNEVLIIWCTIEHKILMKKHWLNQPQSWQIITITRLKCYLGHLYLYGNVAWSLTRHTSINFASWLCPTIWKLKNIWPEAWYHSYTGGGVKGQPKGGYQIKWSNKLIALLASLDRVKMLWGPVPLSNDPVIWATPFAKEM